MSYMELELGLALPIQKPVKIDQSKQIGSELWDPSCCLDGKKLVKNKRSFEESFGCSLGSESLSLLVWSGQPNEEDNRNSGKKNKSTSATNHKDENRVVGWPPIKAWRKKKLLQHQEGYNVRNERIRAAINEGRRGVNPLFVKVKMEGVAIGRKIDLRLHSSYQTLTTTLITMFANYQKFEEGASYNLTYQDKEGDWLLAGDHVPWRSFINSAQRLVILRDGNEAT